MQNNQKTNSFGQCRLCGIPGHHEINIWDGNAHAEPDIELALSVKIFECVGVLVRKDDETTKVCQQCFDMINKYFPFRESCAARNINFMLLKIGVSIERPIDIATAGAIEVDQPNSICEIFSDEEKSSCDQTEPRMCITLTDSESEDGEVNEGSQHTGAHTEYLSARVEPFANGNDDASNKYFPSSHRQVINRSFECHLCKNTFSQMASLRRHMSRTHGQGKRFTCPFMMCSRNSYCEYALQEHIKSRHTKKAISEDCKQSMNCIAANKGSQGYSIIKCGWRSCKNFFQSDGDAMYHMEQYHARGLKKTFECHLCKTPIVNVISLKQHMNAKHSHHKSFNCQFCPRIFHHNDSIRRHIKFHHGREAVPLSRNEQIADSKLVDERKNDEFPVHCGWRSCKQVFESKGAKSYHLLLFHRQGAKKSFQCHLCKTTLVSIGSLEQHMIGLHGRHTPLKCQYSDCSAVFKYISGMERHI